MPKLRYYIQQDVNHPKTDLWAEFSDTQTAYPKVHIFGIIDGHPAKYLSLSAPAAARLAKVIAQFGNKIMTVDPEYRNSHDNGVGK